MYLFESEVNKFEPNQKVWDVTTKFFISKDPPCWIGQKTSKDFVCGTSINVYLRLERATSWKDVQAFFLLNLSLRLVNFSSVPDGCSNLGVFSAFRRSAYMSSDAWNSVSGLPSNSETILLRCFFQNRRCLPYFLNLVLSLSFVSNDLFSSYLAVYIQMWFSVSSFQWFLGCTLFVCCHVSMSWWIVPKFKSWLLNVYPYVCC